MFGKTMDQDLSYRLVGVYKYGKMYCGSYNKTEDGEESITSIATGEKFHSISEFIWSVRGLGSDSELLDLMIYDESSSEWYPLYMCLDINYRDDDFA